MDDVPVPLVDPLAGTLERRRPEWARQIKAALDLINPDCGHRQECKARIVLALESIEFYRTAVYDKRSPATRKREYHRTAKTLEKAVSAAEGQQLPDPVLCELQHYAAEYGQAADRIVVRAGDGRKPSPVKQHAADRARQLLEDFGRPASQTHKGPWHRLANILYGRDDNLFDYLRR
jgi:hypothetical protein